MELFLIYIWLKLDILFYFVGVITAGAIVACLFSAMNMDKTWEGVDYVKRNKQNRDKYFIYSVIFSVALIAIPSKTDVAILVGANYAFKAAATPEAQKVMTLIRKKANEMLDEQLKEEKK